MWPGKQFVCIRCPLTDTGTQGRPACAADLSSSPRRPRSQVGKTSLYTSTLGNMMITVPAKAGKEGTSFNLGAGLFPGQSSPPPGRPAEEPCNNSHLTGSRMMRRQGERCEDTAPDRQECGGEFWQRTGNSKKGNTEKEQMGILPLKTIKQTGPRLTKELRGERASWKASESTYGETEGRNPSGRGRGKGIRESQQQLPRPEAQAPRCVHTRSGERPSKGNGQRA